MAEHPSGNAPDRRSQRRIAWGDVVDAVVIVAMVGLFAWLVHWMGHAGLFRD